MHENILTWHAGCQGNRDLAFAGAIHEEIVGLSPFGDGFAEEGFARVGDLRRSRDSISVERIDNPLRTRPGWRGRKYITESRNRSAREARSCPAMKSESFSIVVESGNRVSLSATRMGSVVFFCMLNPRGWLLAEEQLVPHFPVLHGSGGGDRCAGFDGRRAGLADGDHRQVAILDIMAIDPRPLLHG